MVNKEGITKADVFAKRQELLPDFTLAAGAKRPAAQGKPSSPAPSAARVRPASTPPAAGSMKRPSSAPSSPPSPPSGYPFPLSPSGYPMPPKSWDEVGEECDDREASVPYEDAPPSWWTERA